MGNAMTHNVFKVTADPISCAMLISLAKDGINLGSIQIDTKEASQIAAIVLGSARDAYDSSGKPPPYSGKEEISLTAISPSGFGVGPGPKSGSAMLIFHFGDSALGIELPQSELQTFGQRLMTLAADEGSAQ
jgi:hypothetical protein